MKVTIIIPTFNASDNLNLSLPFFEELSNHANFDVCFIDSLSKDDTLKRLVDCDLRLIGEVDPDEFDHGGTRTFYGRLSEGDIVLYLTQDALPFSVSDVERLVSVFHDKNVGAAFGRQIPYKETSLFGKHLRKFNYNDESYIRDINDKDLYGIKTAFLSNSFAAYRRSAMDEIGWFKDGLILGEDTYAGAKLLKKGYKLAYVADAQVYHSHSYTVLEEFKRYFDIGVFHNMEGWILDEFGRPEGEGMRYVKSELNYLFKHNAYYLFPEFIVRNAMKYLGYKLGRNFECLPKNVVKKFSMHHRWWNKYFKEIL